MYQLWRDVHLLLGLFFLSFILMFGVSSLNFSHHSWFDTEPATDEAVVPVDPARAGTPRELARLLMETEGYRGELGEVRDAEGQIGFNIGRMGTVHDVAYTRGETQAHVKTRVWPFSAMLTWMHATFLVQHEYPLHNVWGWLMLLTSLGLLALGGTGLYLWFKLKKERRIGVVLLSANVVAGVALIVLLWIG
ncbi:MAG: PepSY domain-containing protein [Acidobacteria bacterium]|jgi:hypothetical protein|nr:PepSY domain-containing protein [Acidobacteriota bacterium]